MIESQINEDLYKAHYLPPRGQRQGFRIASLLVITVLKEIAEETNVSINTALGRMRYAVGNIQKLMVKHNISLEF